MSSAVAIARWLRCVVAGALLAAPSLAVAVTFPGPTSSQPLALDAGSALLVVANPDNDSVSLFKVAGDRNRRSARIAVQDEPWGVAIMPDASKIYVANTASGTVSVIARDKRGRFRPPTLHIPVGTEPYGLALTPNGTRLYVANARSNSISVIDTSTDTVLHTIFTNVGREPRGLAITNDGDADDTDETVYVTRFLALLRPGKTDGADDAKAGHVTVVSTATDTVVADVVLNPLVDTGFDSNGDALGRIPPGPSPVIATGAYPNQLNAVAIRGRFAYVPSTGASPNGPLRFDTNVQSLVSVIDGQTQTDAGRTINLNLAVQQQTSPARRFLTVPWSLAVGTVTDAAWVVSAASNVVAQLTLDPTAGGMTVANDPADPTRVLEIPTGKNPRGIVVNADDSRAYVMNYVSRDVTVIDLTSARVLKTVVSEKLPKPKSLDGRIQIGKELYNTSVGEFDAPAKRVPRPMGRMSRDGWGSCAACHPFGLSDGVTWIFHTGPRRTISQHTDFDLTDPARGIQRALGWSAIFDEETDLERYVRDVSGGDGLIVGADGVTPDPDLPSLLPTANTGRRQLTVRGIPAWDAIAVYVAFGIRPPRSPVPATDPDVVSGRALFTAANCQECHGGPQWTSSRVRFTPPPPPGAVVLGQLIGELRIVGTFSPASFNEVRDDASTPLGAAGFAPASLLSVGAYPGPFLHNGAADSLTTVLQNVSHRSAGTGGVDTLANAADRDKIVRFLQSIDATTTPVP